MLHLVLSECKEDTFHLFLGICQLIKNYNVLASPSSCPTMRQYNKFYGYAMPYFVFIALFKVIYGYKGR